MKERVKLALTASLPAPCLPIERRGKNHKGNGGFAGGINKVVDGATGDIDDIAYCQIDAASLHH
jgi:hypothetical protein